MSRKHYVMIAAAFKHANECDYSHLPPTSACAYDGIAEAARSVADVLARDNARFDRDRFLAACGVAK